MTSPNVATTLDFHIERPGIVHGLASWIEITTAEGIFAVDSPLDSRRMLWDQLTLPFGVSCFHPGGRSRTGHNSHFSSGQRHNPGLLRQDAPRLLTA